MSLIDGLPSDDFVYLACTCVAAMVLRNIVKDELMEQVEEVTGIAAFLEKLERASIVLYV